MNMHLNRVVTLSDKEKEFAKFIGYEVMNPSGKGINLGLAFSKELASDGIIKPSGVNVFYPDDNTIIETAFDVVELILPKKKMIEGVCEATKKPITIEFIQFNMHNKDKIESFVGTALDMELESETAYVAGVAPPVFSLTIQTLEGKMKAMPGDYIIKGIKGEFYPCKPDIFEASYNIVPFATMGVANSKHNSCCLQKAQDDEPIFVLLARDHTAPEAIVKWVGLNLNFQPFTKLAGALQVADQMIQWRDRKVTSGEISNIIDKRK